jgi:acetolactate synthase-1/2/3 large subunit
MRLSDYVLEFLEQRGVEDVFLVSGGGIMYLLDALGRRKTLTYHCNYHEQASSICAEGYARTSSRPAVCFATVGPGAVNAISGLLGAWVDSVPLLIISGQVRTALIADYAKLRQYGPQEANAVGMALPVTKYAVSVRDPLSIRCVLERAFYEMQSGRPGPVLIELPLDVQNAEVDPAALAPFERSPIAVSSAATTLGGVDDAAALVRAARRPLLVAGNGVRSANAVVNLLRFAETFGVPMVFPFTAKDLVEENHPLQMGVFGTAGQRRANFVVQNADCIISVGAGLNIQKIGFNPGDFGRYAKKIIVDIDVAQLTLQPVKPDVAVHSDAALFLSQLQQNLIGQGSIDIDPRWLEVCRFWKKRYPPFSGDNIGQSEDITSYELVKELSHQLSCNDIVVTGNGIDAVSVYQVFEVKHGQRILLSGWGSMGWDLPLAYGAYVGSGKKRVVCICGDGSIQWNIQELLTISKAGADIKIFVVNNSGYTAIRTTQDNLFESRYVGADPTSGVFNPEFRWIAKAYTIDYSSISRKSCLAEQVANALKQQGPHLIEVVVRADQGISPKASAFRRQDGTLESRPLEDMAPFLTREEIAENMSYFKNSNK